MRLLTGTPSVGDTGPVCLLAGAVVVVVVVVDTAVVIAVAVIKIVV